MNRSLTNAGFGIALLALTVTMGAAAPSTGHAHDNEPVITVYRDPSCGCCKSWITHLIKHSYQVVDKTSDEMAEIKRGLGVPENLQSCHTGVVNGYVIEGHVPAADITRLLKEKPTVVGIAVPGMPVGSPGMEGSRVDRYDVIAFKKDGKTEVYAKH
ncbi:MAG TPA: DUF411 domain-containing protein [Gemmatimonadaceae bacterium]|nr:DUF411 domain-containing protein [Gemmatimonadaceae bacterium]